MTHCLDAMPRTRILLTGGSGFVGSALLEAFRDSSANAEVFATSRRWAWMAAGEEDSRVHWIERENMRLPSGITHIVHLEPDMDTKITECLAQTAALIGARVIYASSGAAKELNTHYARSKRANEQLLSAHSFTFKFPVCIARLWAFIGPRLPFEPYAAGNFIRDGLAGGPLVVRGTGKTVRSYLHTSDLAEWLWTITLHGTSGVIYNVGSEYPVTIQELANMMAAEFGGMPVVVLGDERVPSTRYVPDASATRNELSLAQRVNLRDAIRLTVGWFRENVQCLVVDQAR